MRRMFLMIFCAFSGLVMAKSGAADKVPEKKDVLDSLSYALGLEIGSSLKEHKVDLPSFNRGLEDMMKGRQPLIASERANQIKQEYFQRFQAQQSEQSKRAGEEFLEKNKKNKGVMVTASGLQYIVERQGTGPKPKATDQVTVNYKGTLLDGKEFDNSYTRGQPATFPLNGVIPGWTEGLQIMNVGSKYKFFIPSRLGYGERGAGASIPPNAVLVFEVELLSIGAPAGDTGKNGSK